MSAKKQNKATLALKSAQVNRGMIQADVAKRMGVQQATVSRWYRDIDSMSVGEFRLLCKLLGVSPAEIISLRNGG